MRIAELRFINHAILGNLELSFRDHDGIPLDVIIFAGENGSGKSQILYTINLLGCDYISVNEGGSIEFVS